MNLKELTGYLPYGLKVIVKYKEEAGVLDLVMLSKYKAHVSNGGSVHLWQEQHIDKIKPILRPMSDLKKIKNKECYEKLSNNLKFNIDMLGFPNYLDLKVNDYNILLEHHFDIHNLIEKGEAIDINTIKK